jgi:hypothetical protein
MRGPHRQRLLLTGKIWLVVFLATSALVALAAGRLGWTNYWGGFVHAPIALIIAVLLAMFVIKKDARREQRRGAR